MKDVERLCVFAFFEQLPAPQVGRIQFGRVDRVFDHTHAAQVAAEFHGPQRGIVLRTDAGIFGRVAAANLLLAPVGISDAADDAENLVAVREAAVTGDAGCQLRPQLARAAYRKQAVRTPAEASREVAAQRLGTRLRKALVERTAAFGRGRSRKDDAVDMELPLRDDTFHECGDACQLPCVVAQRIHEPCVARKEAQAVTVVDGHVFVDDADTVPGQGIQKRQQRRYGIGQRIGRRQRIGAVVEPLDAAPQRDEHLAGGLLRRYFLRIIVADRSSVLDKRIEPCILRIGIFHEPLESPLGLYAVGAEASQVGSILPVVALLHAVEQRTAYDDVVERDLFVLPVQEGRDDHAAAAPQQLFGQLHVEVERHTPPAFGDRTDTGHNDDLLDRNRAEGFALPVPFDGDKVVVAAVAFHAHDLRAVVPDFGLAFCT